MSPTPAPIPGFAAALKIPWYFLKNVGCKVACGKLPKTNSLPKDVWDKWTAGLVPRDDDVPGLNLELQFPGLTILHPGSSIPEGFRISFASPDRDNTTAVFEVDGREVVGNLTGWIDNARGIQFGNFSIVDDVLEDVFGEWITIDESVPETVRSTLSAVSDAVDDGQITYEELESILDVVRGQKHEN